MHPNTEMGLNRTGVQLSPLDVDRMLEATEQLEPDVIDDDSTSDVSALRMDYIDEADPVGTVPVPMTVKGRLKAGIEKIAGRQPETLIDKLGERLAFERSGVRLYEALLMKCEAMPDDAAAISVEMLRDFRNQEADHFQLAADALQDLGADSTAQTPCADVSGVATMGLLQVLNDPRTTLSQCLHAILVAELTDNAGWELLIKLANDVGQAVLADRFRDALLEEQRHLAQITLWHDQSVRKQV
jgi:bacterioferritin (cytochrome b1)